MPLYRFTFVFLQWWTGYEWGWAFCSPLLWTEDPFIGHRYLSATYILFKSPTSGFGSWSSWSSLSLDTRETISQKRGHHGHSHEPYQPHKTHELCYTNNCGKTILTTGMAWINGNSCVAWLCKPLIQRNLWWPKQCPPLGHQKLSADDSSIAIYRSPATQNLALFLGPYVSHIILSIMQLAWSLDAINRVPQHHLIVALVHWPRGAVWQRRHLALWWRTWEVKNFPNCCLMVSKTNC